MRPSASRRLAATTTLPLRMVALTGAGRTPNSILAAMPRWRLVAFGASVAATARPREGTVVAGLWVPDK
ncbi:hypothetical protein ACFY1C_34940 [Streptomyces sp. NPDC001279]|uniref:hypothetical protein n=1 Tax=Streptomyces sp. NPDC001279 TaxID=3364556 RepID=UPI0036A3CFA0